MCLGYEIECPEGAVNALVLLRPTGALFVGSDAVRPEVLTSQRLIDEIANGQNQEKYQAKRKRGGALLAKTNGTAPSLRRALVVRGWAHRT